VINNSNPTVQLKKPHRGQSLINQQVAPGGFYTIIARVANFKYSTGGLGQLAFN
jgi:hypothetical protein